MSFEAKASKMPIVSITPLHMQCQTATVTDDQGSVSGVVEFGTEGQLLIWENEFRVEENRRKKLLSTLCEYIASKGLKYEVFWGKGRDY